MPNNLRTIEASSPDSLDGLGRICAELKSRLNAAGVKDLGFDENREQERRYLSEPERIVRTLTTFFCGCSNAGTLYEHLDWGLNLLPEITAIGATGCANALRGLVSFQRKDQQLQEQSKAGEITDDEYDRRWAAMLQERAEIEREAEGDFLWADLLWRYALEHRAEILSS